MQILADLKQQGTYAILPSLGDGSDDLMEVLDLAHMTAYHNFVFVSDSLLQVQKVEILCLAEMKEDYLRMP